MATSEGTNFFYHRVQVHVPHPVELVMMVAKPHTQPDKNSPALVALSQVYKVLVDGTCSYQHFHSKVKMYLDHRYKSYMLKGEDMQVMVRLGATGPTTTSLLVVSCSAVVKAMVTCHAPKTHIDAMEAIRLNSINMECLPIPPHVLSPHPQALPAPPTQLKVMGDLPVSLPSYQLPSNVKKVYGLFATKPDLAQTHPLHHQVSQLKAWWTSPIQLDRQGQALSSSSFHQHLTHISLFLGHCHWFQGVAKPNLEHYLDPMKVLDYINMKVALQQSPHTINSVLDTAVVVLKWFMSLPLGGDPSLPKAITWMLTLSSQVSCTLC